MTSNNYPKLVYGGYHIQPPNVLGEGSGYTDQESVDKLLDIFKKYGVDTIDTALIYARNEEALGQFGVAKKGYTIDTKHALNAIPVGDKITTAEQIVNAGKEQIKRIGVDKVDIYYLHTFDETIPLETQLDAINQLYKAGVFSRFGISNFHPNEIRETYKLCKEKGYPLPKVYQGNYNAFARGQEKDVFPVLRELGIAFYAYSPIAGGFLTKTREDVVKSEGKYRADAFISGLYEKMYNKDTMLQALDKWGEIAEKEGVKRGELAYRWAEYNSTLSGKEGDALIFGARTFEQAEETLGWLKKGPLSDEAVKGIDEIWELVKADSQQHNTRTAA